MEQSTNSVLKKRSFQQLESEKDQNGDRSPDQHPAKKQKLDNVNDNVPSNADIFQDEEDQEQFQEIFDTVEQCELTKLFSIPKIINQRIAEYATGWLEECGCKQCENVVVVLYGDTTKYKKDHSNCQEFGYKDIGYCEPEYYCAECMDSFKTCDCNCGEISYIPECKRCTKCSKVLFQCESMCECSFGNFQCEYCGEATCSECVRQDPDFFGMMECAGCFRVCCCKCTKLPAGKDMDFGVCPDCYEESMMVTECKYCGEKSPGMIYDSEYHFIVFMPCQKCGKRRWAPYCRFEDKPDDSYCCSQCKS